MSIIELGALGEFLGSIGVIATLVYLAVHMCLTPWAAMNNLVVFARQQRPILLR